MAKTVTPEARLYRKHHLRMMREYPGSITPAQYKAFVLTTADADGQLYPPPLGDFFARHSIMVSMHLVDKTVEIRSRHDEPIRWFIREAVSGGETTDG